MRVESLQSKTKQLAQWVQTDANRPVISDDEKIISSVACEGLRRDYMRMCTGYNGGLHIVYDEMGAGKSCALQAVARAKSSNQPDRFLVLNFLGTRTCQDLYKGIKDRVLGPVEDFEFTPEEVAEVVGHGLCGLRSEQKKLPKTSNACRITIDAAVRAWDKTTNFNILVIDEFNPSDFTWPQGADYGIKELEDEIGDAFRFFNALTGLAHEQIGFAVFVGTKSEAFARALHKINGGSKASLARSTTREPTRTQTGGNYPFDDWQGFQWSTEDKAKVVRGVYGEQFKKLLLKKGTSRDEAEIQTINVIQDLCVGKNIRQCCLDMEETIYLENESVAVIIQSRTQDSPTAAGCFVGFKEQCKSIESCAIM